SNVTGPSGEIVADPAHVTVGWTVTNAGTLTAQAAGWVDIVYASTSATGSGLIEVARFARTTSLAPGASYSRSEDVVLPPAFAGRFYLYVKADGTNVVFEDTVEANNTARTAGTFDVMPIPYADLRIPSVTSPSPAASGQTTTVSWRVENRGIGLTNTSNW